MTITQRYTQENETEILRRVVTALLAIPNVTGIDVDDGGDEVELHNATDFEKIKETCFGVDECHLFVKQPGERRQWVYFIWGNGNLGLNCISDYGISLEEPLKPVFDWIEEQDVS